MNLDKLNNWFAVIANIGVLIGILFLAYEVRLARTSIELQLYEAQTQGYASFNEMVINSSEAAGALGKGLYNPNALSDTEIVQFSMLMVTFRNNVARLYRLRDGSEESERNFEGAVRQYESLLRTPGGQVFRENWPGFRNTPSEILELMASYADDPPALNFILNRDPEGFGAN